MLAINVSVEAEMIVRAELAPSLQVRSAGALSRAALIERIELFVDALNPHRIIFGTAEVEGNITALPAHILGLLSATYARGAQSLKPVRPLKYL